MNKQKAREILPAIVDNEATIEEQVAFFDFIEQDYQIRKEYSEAIFIKKLYRTKFKKAEAPKHLTDRVVKIINALEQEDAEDVSSIFSRDKNGNDTLTKTAQQPNKTTGHLLRYFAAAAVVLFATLVTIQILDRTTFTQTELPEFIVEYMAAEHFLSAKGQFIEPHFGTHSHTEAEDYLIEHFGMTITVPEIDGAQFEGLIMADFIEDFKTPLLEYSQEDLGETIYLFAFDVEKVLQHKALARHDDAVATCITEYDFYVAEIEDHHVVSWLWENTWYSAISNHNGYDLASLVVPLQYSR